MTRKILVIDDDPAIHKLLVKHLSNWRTEVCSAKDGEAGVAMTRERQPDMILLDVDMPGMTGHEVCRRLKADPATSSIPVLFLTAAGATSDKIIGLDAGAVDYISKPFDPFEVAARTRVAFRTKWKLEQAASNAMTDEMTGLYNRAAFELHLNAELARARRSAQPMACMVIEADHLEDVARDHGFAGCDEVLRDQAALLKHTCREEDVIFRYHERQFAILAPNINVDNVIDLGERLRWALHSHPTFWEESTIETTVSIGLAVSHFSFGRSVVTEAEDALAEAQKAGGNTVIAGGELAELRLAI